MACVDVRRVIDLCCCWLRNSYNLNVTLLVRIGYQRVQVLLSQLFAQTWVGAWLWISYALGQELQFAGSHLLVSLFSFNIGIEIGQLLVLLLMLPALVLFRRVVPERTGVILLSALAAHTGWHWMLERWAVLKQTEWPRLDAAAILTLAQWLGGLLLAFAVARLLAGRLG